MNVEAVVEATVKRLAPHVSGEPLLWTVKAAVARTSLPRDRLVDAFHAGRIEGLWSGGVRGKGSILLKPESVMAWIDAQVREQSENAAVLGRCKERAAR